MNSLSDKPGIVGTIGTIGQAATTSVKNEVKRTIENSAEQLGMKEKKEGAPSAPDAATIQAQEAARKQQSQDVANWLYGTTPEAPPAPAIPEKKPEAQIADIKAQLGLEQKPVNTANVVEQLGMAPDPNAKPTATLTDQLNFMPSPTLTPEEQQKKQKLTQELHNDYYQRLITPPKAPETEERMKEAQEKQETPQERMERQMQEDLKKKQEEAAKKQLDPGVEMAHNMEKNRGSSG